MRANHSSNGSRNTLGFVSRSSIIRGPACAGSGHQKKRRSIGTRSCPRGFTSFPGDGWWRTPNHSTPETLRLTEPPPRPMLGISGLLQLLTWVEHRRVVQASQHEEGGVPCPIPHPTRFPPVRFQASNQLVGGSAPGQSSATPLAAESPARTPTGTEQRTK